MCTSLHLHSQEDDEDLQRRKLALKKLLALRQSQTDKVPVLVEDGLYIGGFGQGGCMYMGGCITHSYSHTQKSGGISAASNKKALYDAGISAVVCASAVVPAYFPGEFDYHAVSVYDEATQDILSHIPASNEFIQQV